MTGAHHHGPLAGIGAGVAAVAVAAGVIAAEWHRIAAPVGDAAITITWCAAISACVVVVLGTAHLVLRVAHYHLDATAARAAQAGAPGPALEPAVHLHIHPGVEPETARALLHGGGQ